MSACRTNTKNINKNLVATHPYSVFTPHVTHPPPHSNPFLTRYIPSSPPIPPTFPVQGGSSHRAAAPSTLSRVTAANALKTVIHHMGCQFMDRQHGFIKEICQNKDCKSKSCNMRHPKPCKYFMSHKDCNFAELCFNS